MTEGQKQGAGCLLFVVAVAAGLGFLFRDELARYRLQLAFPEASLREFEAASKFPAGADSVAPGEVPWRRGKVVLVVPRVTTKDLGDTIITETEVQPPLLQDDMSKLPDEIVARRPEEVGTVIICTPDRRRTGERWVRIQVYDLASKTCVGEGALDGTFPQRQLQRGDSASAVPADVAGFVLRMPAR